MIDWQQLEDTERRRWDEEQEILKADPGYQDWLDSLNKRTEEDCDGDA